MDTKFLGDPRLLGDTPIQGPITRFRLSLDERSSRLAILAIAGIVGAVLGAGLARIFLVHIGHDQSWNLYAADQVLRGVRLNGPQLIEVNPPLIIWLSCIPVLAGRLLHIGMLNAFRVIFDVTVLFSLCWTTLLFKHLHRPSLLSVWLFVGACSVLATQVITRDAIGQREHFLFLLCLPYCVHAGARMEGKRLGKFQLIVIGGIAGVAVCLKPQHLVDIAILELIVYLKLRSSYLRSSLTLLAFVAVLVLYIISVGILNPEYFMNVVPLLRMTYGGFNIPFARVLTSAIPVSFVLLSSVLLYILCRQSVSFSSLARVFAGTAVGAAAAYLQQQKGWSYQLIPAGLFTAMFAAMILIGLTDKLLWHAPQIRADQFLPRTAMKAASCLAILTLAAAIVFGHHKGYFDQKKWQLSRILSAYPAGTTVSFLSTQPIEFPVIVEQGKLLGSRFEHLWMVPAILHSGDPARKYISPKAPLESNHLADLQRGEIAADIYHWQPTVVVIDQCDAEICESLKRENYKGLLQWLLEDKEFERQWGEYKLLYTAGDLEVFSRAKDIAPLSQQEVFGR